MGTYIGLYAGVVIEVQRSGFLVQVTRGSRCRSRRRNSSPSTGGQGQKERHASFKRDKLWS